MLLLVIVRLFWRNSQPAPAHLSTNKTQNFIATVVHWMVYFSMFMIPILGIVMSQTGGHDISIFGLFNLPVLFAENEVMNETAKVIHASAWFFMILVVVVHTVAALKHHFVDKDRALMRIIKGE